MKRLLPVRWLPTVDAGAQPIRETASEDRREARHRIRVASAIGFAAYLWFLFLDWTRVLGGS